MTDRLDIPIHGPYHHPLGPDPIPGGFAVRELKVFEETVSVIAGDKAYAFEIPEDLHESILVKCEAYVTTPSTSGSIEIQLRRLDDGLGAGSDMLTTKITIEPNEVNSKTAAANLQPVVNLSEALLDHGDHIAIDIDNAGAGAKGLGVIVVIAPLFLASAVLKGAKGDPGGITDFTGAWNGSTSYTTGEAVSNAGSSYVAIANSTGVEPGVTPGWESSWMLLAGNQQFTVLSIPIGDPVAATTPGIKQRVEIPFACTIVAVRLFANISGNAVVDIWKDSYINYPPTVADSICGGTKPSLVNEIKSQDTALSGWTTSIAVGDILLFNIDSISAFISSLTISLTLRRI